MRWTKDLSNKLKEYFDPEVYSSPEEFLEEMKKTQISYFDNVNKQTLSSKMQEISKNFHNNKNKNIQSKGLL